MSLYVEHHHRKASSGGLSVQCYKQDINNLCLYFYSVGCIHSFIRDPVSKHVRYIDKSYVVVCVRPPPMLTSNTPKPITNHCHSLLPRIMDPIQPLTPEASFSEIIGSALTLFRNFRDSHHAASEGWC